MTSAVLDCAAWLYGVLEPDSTLRTALGGAGRVYHAPGPQWTASNPEPSKYVLFQLQSGLPLVCLGPQRAGEDLIWFVRVYGVGLPYSALGTAFDRVETLLWNTTGTSAGWEFTCNDDPLFGVEMSADPEEGGPQHRYVGRFWRVTALAA